MAIVSVDIIYDRLLTQPEKKKRRARRADLGACNSISIWLSSMRLPNPSLIGPGSPARRPSANQGVSEAHAAEVAPRGNPPSLAAPGEDWSPSPVQKSLRVTTTPTHR